VTRPTPDQLALLTPTERLSFAWCELVNGVPAFKAAAHAFLRHVGANWVHPCTKNLLHVEGLAGLRALRPPAGVLLVANHRSFFDMYVLSMILFRETDLLGRIYFPVRAEFFYDHPAGLVVNGLMSGWSMYPPVVRQPTRNDFNDFTMGRIAELLAQRGTLIGFHPEGTRNKTDDPYTLLPAYPGVGQLIHRARPTVIPAFILGMGNRLVRQIRANFDGTGRRIIIVFGAPLDLAGFLSQAPRLRTYVELARFVRAELMRLGERERALRADLEPGLPPLGPEPRAEAVSRAG
jgi:1-acyl-sn-glycerol-3-phosphate acyltransferase